MKKSKETQKRGRRKGAFTYTHAGTLMVLVICVFLFSGFLSLMYAERFAQILYEMIYKAIP
jgi:hypothetical protein